MTLGDLLLGGLWGVRSRPLRSGALVLALAAGVAAAVFVGAVVAGFGREIDRLAFGSYARALVVRENIFVDDRYGPPRLSDLVRLENDLDNLDAHVAWKMGRAQTQVRSEAVVFSVYGVRGRFEDEVDSPIVAGRTLTAEETRGADRICLVGAETAERLKRSRLVGSRLRIEGVDCEIVGVLGEPRSRPASRFVDAVLMPLAAAERHFIRDTDLGPGEVDSLTLFMPPGSDMSRVEMQVDRLLRKDRGAPLSRPSPFTYGVPTASFKQLSQQRDMIARLLSAVAALSIFASVLAFAAISAATISSRRREIALRMSMGASRTDIELQIVTEALIVGAVGSAVGLVIGLSLAYGLSQTWSWPFAPSPFLAALAVLLGIGTGLAVGFTLARQAASLSPSIAARS